MTKNKQYSFESYCRIPKTIPKHHDINTDSVLDFDTYEDSLRHKRVDNDLIYDRLSSNIAINGEQCALGLNNTKPGQFGNFQSQRNETVVSIGTLTRRESTDSQEKFQFKYNRDLLIQPPVRPMNSRIQNKGNSVNIKETTGTRKDPIPNIDPITARDVTNTNRFFGNITTVTPSTNIDAQIKQQCTRHYELDNNKMYTYQGQNVLQNDQKRYNDAKVQAHNERLTLPQPHQHPCHGIQDFGDLCRRSLPDDDTLTKRLFELGPNKKCIDDMKLIPNLRVFPASSLKEMKQPPTTITRQPKSFQETQTQDNYAFQTAPLLQEDLTAKRNSARTQTSLANTRESSRKSTTKIVDSNSKYVLSNIGTKAPRQPMTNTHTIGVNTTIVH